MTAHLTRTLPRYGGGGVRALALLAFGVMVGLGIAHSDDVETKARTLEGAHDCTVSLWGPTESDAVDVADCVDGVIYRTLP